jgi:hypothetical protein
VLEGYFGAGIDGEQCHEAYDQVFHVGNLLPELHFWQILAIKRMPRQANARPGWRVRGKAMILALAVLVLESRENAVAGLREPSPALGGRSRLAAVASDPGAEKVLPKPTVCWVGWALCRGRRGWVPATVLAHAVIPANVRVATISIDKLPFNWFAAAPAPRLQSLGGEWLQRGETAV